MDSSSPQTPQEIATFTSALAQKVDSHNDRRSVVDLPRALQLRLQYRLTYEEIGKRLGCTEHTVSQALQRFLKFVKDPTELEAYRQQKGDLLESIEYKLLTVVANLLENPSPKTSIKDLAVALKLVGDMVRLHRGQSTENVSVLVKAIEEANKGVFAGELPALPATEPDCPTETTSSDAP